MNGAISASSWCRYSESASSMPAMNAPSTIDMPANSMSSAEPMTTSKAVAVNSSGIPAAATVYRTGLSAMRPPIISSASVPIVIPTSVMSKPLSAPACAPSNGSIAISGITARSWSRRMEKAARPYCVASCFFSASICRTNAVDDRASTRPMTIEASAPRPYSQASAAMTEALTRTCAVPRPKTILRMTQSRVGLSSRPMMKSRNTTPSSAKCRMCSAWCTKPKPNGPIRIPAHR